MSQILSGKIGVFSIVFVFKLQRQKTHQAWQGIPPMRMISWQIKKLVAESSRPIFGAALEA